MDYKEIFSILLFLSINKSSLAAKILCISSPHVGHVFPIVQAGKVLQTKYNHTFTVVGDHHLISNPLMANSGVSLIESKRLNEQNFEARAEEVLKIQAEGQAPLFKLAGMFTDMCIAILEDDDLIELLKRHKYDVMITLTSFIGDCLNFVAYKLSLPIVHYGNLFDGYSFGIPVNPSVTPIFPVANYGESMSFRQRVLNNIAFYAKIFVSNLLIRSDISNVYVPEKPYISPKDLRRHVQLTLMDFDVLMDYPRPSMPNTVFVGGLNTAPPAQKLDADFQSIMDSATDGIVVVSFGSVFKSFPHGKLDIIFQAMRKVKSVKFVMKYGKEAIQDANIHLRPWLPQNELLAHKNTKAFITHCGNSGQYEALYNAVPMIDVTINGDQFYNAERMRLKGYGLYTSLLSINVDSLAAMIEEVVKNPSYKDKILKASEIFKSRPGGIPSERAAYWVDHVIKYGGEYMHSIGTELPWYIISD
ncbi:hypothetical protein FSP39_020958 [Pinctada imbricata]|uniref:UDP-glucuronosyltransferase n=1 Tax=Pinctada imbricata TaxID=66713 RepID=A0AA88YM98_PINIB|nr:hypothetical protein FSP39_020958 [Pinctada imbricata]